MSNLKDAIKGLSDVNPSLPSEVEVAMDDLASALILEFELDEDGGKYLGRAPSLFEIIVELVASKKVPSKLGKLCELIADLLKQAYDDELDYEDSQALRNAVENLQKELGGALKLE